MRLRCVLALALQLAACTGGNWSGTAASSPAPSDPNIVPVAVQPVATVPPKIEGFCRDVANARTRDTADQGFDTSIQQAVYDHTYADCVRWSNQLSR